MSILPDGENRENSTYHKMPIRPPRAIGANPKEPFGDIRFAHGATELQSILTNDDFALITQDTATLEDALKCLSQLASTFKPILYRIEGQLCLAICANSQEIVFAINLLQNEALANTPKVILRNLTHNGGEDNDTKTSPSKLQDSAETSLTKLIEQIKERLPKISSQPEQESLLKKLMNAIAHHKW